MMTRRLANRLLAFVYLFVCIGNVAAQSGAVAEYFDTSRTISLKGRVATLILQDSEHTYVLIDVDGTGKTERWAVRGQPAAELGWAPRTAPLKAGDPVTLVAYRAKPGVNLTASLPADHARLAEIASAGRLVHGIEFTLPNGGKVTFGSP